MLVYYRVRGNQLPRDSTPLYHPKYIFPSIQVIPSIRHHSKQPSKLRLLKVAWKIRVSVSVTWLPSSPALPFQKALDDLEDMHISYNSFRFHSRRRIIILNVGRERFESREITVWSRDINDNDIGLGSVGSMYPRAYHDIAVCHFLFPRFLCLDANHRIHWSLIWHPNYKLEDGVKLKASVQWLGAQVSRDQWINGSNYTTYCTQ